MKKTERAKNRGPAPPRQPETRRRSLAPAPTGRTQTCELRMPSGRCGLGCCCNIISVSRESDVKRPTRPTQDDVVSAVLSGASHAARLAAQFTATVGDPTNSDSADFPEIACGGFVSFKDLTVIYEDYGELWPLQGRLSARRIKALEQGAALSPAEKSQYTKRKLAAYFAEPIDGEGYAIFAVGDSTGRRAYWAEIRSGYAWEGIERQVLGLFRSVGAAKSALRQKGLISARDYQPQRGRPGTTRPKTAGRRSNTRDRT
jgi:hypothetical protein